MDKIKDVVSDVDYVVLSLPRTQDVEEVLHQDDGVFAHASKGTYILDSSTISPVAAKDFSATAVKNEMVYLDTPMSGGVLGAKNATLTFMVGADT